MEPHNDESKKAPEPHKEERPHRFRIVRLEERIAPRRPNYRYHYPGWYKHGHYAPPGQEK